MKRLIPVVCLFFVACGKREVIQAHDVEITSRPAAVEGVPSSHLQVPRSCPIYAPGGGDVDTPEPPFPYGVSIICAVDDAGASYGIVNGDAPTAHLAVLPGNREIGLYIGFEPGWGIPPDRVDLTGPSPTIAIWAAPTNVESQDDCCPEAHPDARLDIRPVALGPEGILVTLGHFDRKPIQVGGFFELSYAFRFYVNGPP